VSVSLTEWILGAYGALSLTAFVAYGWDKLQAKRGGWRVPEKNLHVLALIGGFAGAFLGMRVFRHKTKHPMFAVMIGVSVVVHGGVWVWVWMR